MVLSRLPVFVVATAVTLLVVPSRAGAQALPSRVYTLNRAASAVGFTISASMLLTVKRNGIFQNFEGNLSYDPARPTDRRRARSARP